MLMTRLLEHRAIDLMAARLVTLNESDEDEADVARATLQCLHNMSEIEPEKVPEAIAVQPQLLPWLRKRLNPRKAFDANKASAAELLAITALVRACWVPA